MQIVIVAGMLAAGKSIALRVFQDLGYYCVDNLPPKLINTFIDLVEKSEPKLEKVAIVLDARGVVFFDNLPEILDELKQEKSASILFIDADNDVLINRYKSNRRKHLLSGNEPVLIAIEKERETMKPVRDRADIVIDTSFLRDAQLKRQLENLYSQKSKKERFVIDVVSFGFKYGILKDADLVFDVRFLPNPYYDKNLCNMTGNEKEVSDFVFNSEITQGFIDRLEELLKFTVPHYVDEGKMQLIIGVGCTGGRHRSVAVANEISRYLSDLGYKVLVNHRDIYKDSYKFKED